MDSTCEECGSPYTPKSKRSRYCTDKCRYKARDRARMVPCSMCGEPMHLGGANRNLPADQRAHNQCRSGLDQLTKDGAHNAARYHYGCRCSTCRDAATSRVREYNQRTGYYSRPEVRERRAAWARSDEGKAKLAAQRRAWAQANPDKASALSRSKKDRRRKAKRINYTSTQLMQRMSMFSACWICNEELGDDWHKDHVKPLARGGWDMLGNLRPAHAACNISKGAKWPFEPSKAS